MNARDGADHLQAKAVTIRSYDTGIVQTLKWLENRIEPVVRKAWSRIGDIAFRRDTVGVVSKEPGPQSESFFVAATQKDVTLRV